MRLLNACLICGIVALSMGLQSPATQPASGLAKIAWIHGAWMESRPDGTKVEEYWSPPRAGIMLGAGRTSKGDKLMFFEHLRIMEASDGSVTYFAQPRGRPATPFKAVEITDERVVFENLEHDFPTRVIYERDGANGLKARTEGKQGTRNVTESWNYKRMGS